MAEVFGVDVPDLPDGHVPLTAAVLVNALTPEGEQTLVCRYSPELTSWHLMGMLDAALSVERAHLVSNFESE